MKEEEIRLLGEEWTRRDEALTNEWYKTHRRVGRDGGPIEQRKKLQEEMLRRFNEIIKKYNDGELN